MSDRQADQRVPCCVVGCRRTFKKDVLDQERPIDELEYMCGDDYRRTDHRIRALRAKIKRRVKKAGWSLRLMKMDNRLWEKAKQQATERRMGL
jgi:hypothetical protein